MGPIGAGKSRTIKILSGILTPTSGQCAVGGLVPWQDRIAHVGRVGVVFGQRTQLWWDLPVIESFNLLRDIYRVPEARFRVTADRMIGLLGLEPHLDTPVRQLSLGQRMRADIAAAMLHEPRILFLDEPTAGVDVELRHDLWNIVRSLRESGVTIILTTHYIEEAEQLADRVGVINHGEIILVEEKNRLMREVGKKQLELQWSASLVAVPAELNEYHLELNESGSERT